MSRSPQALQINQEDVAKLLACNVHIGAKTLEPGMDRYIWTRRKDSVHIIDLRKTWEKLILAARVIVAIENPADVCVISARPFGQRAILKFAKYTGATPVAGRFTPGTFTNQIQDRFTEPRLLVITDPRSDHQPIRESSYVNIPTIAFCNTDSPLRHVDIAIPCNNKSKNAIGLMWWILCREVLYLRAALVRGQPWDVMVDLFFYRDPEEQEKDMAQIQDVYQTGYEEQNADLLPSDNWGEPPSDWPGTSEWGTTSVEGQGNWAEETSIPQMNPGWAQQDQ